MSKMLVIYDTTSLEPQNFYMFDSIIEEIIENIWVFKLSMIENAGFVHKMICLARKLLWYARLRDSEEAQIAQRSMRINSV